MYSNLVILQATTDFNENLVKLNKDKIPLLTLNFSKKSQVTSEALDFKNSYFIEYFCYFLGLNSINFQFWDVVEDEFLRYEYQGKVGAMAMQEGYKQAWLTSKALQEADCSKNSSKTEAILSQLHIVVDNNYEAFFGNLPEKTKRIEILKEFDLKKDLIVELAGHLYAKINRDQKLDEKDAYLVASYFPAGYKDDYVKKAQLFLMFLASQVAYNRSSDIQLDLTAAADYQLPKVLKGLGILSYSTELERKISNKELIEANSAEEKAIRAATVLACEEIKQYFNVKIENIDFALWNIRNEFKHHEFHLTKTTHY